MYKLFLLLFTLTAAIVARPAYAHGFGERYDLPVPLEYYLVGAAAAVAFSFIIIAFLFRGTPNNNNYWRLNLLIYRPIAVLLQARAFAFLVKSVSVLLFLLIIATGIWGDKNPGSNFSPTFVWIIWWVGLGFFISLVGNIWVLLNPWKAIYECLELMYMRMNPDGQLDLGYKYPNWLGIWPAFILFLSFAWLENSFPESSDPKNIAIFIMAYSFITWVGMFLFGTHVWIRHGETFSVIFAFLARFAPTEIRITHRDYCTECDSICSSNLDGCINCYLCWNHATLSERELNLRPYGVGLTLNEGISGDTTALIILMLSTVTFDGFRATPVWGDIQSALYDTAVNISGNHALTVINTLGLMLFPCVFLMVYILVCWSMRRALGYDWDTLSVASVFVYSLIPIALAYNIAHFFTLLVIQGQLIIPLASDPFGYGWDLLGTSQYRVNIGLVNARFTWTLGVTVIVLGHIMAIYVAHIIALRNISGPRNALRSQYPLLVLMVIYTVISLWIIAQPILEHS